MTPKDTVLSRSATNTDLPSADGRFVRQLQEGDVDAGWRFVHEHYPSIYRYLLYLTGRPETAEDLTQETFLHAWRCLSAFDEKASLRPWLHGIAHRQYLQALRARRPETALEGMAEPGDPRARAMTEAIEWRAVLDRLPVGEREVVVLHHLEGYSYREIAAITGAPVGRVTQRLFQARERLRRELGQGDLAYLNEPSVPMRQWAWLPLDEMYALATRLTSGESADRKASRPGGSMEEPMERREFLRQAAVGAAGLMLSETDKEVVDSRLTQKVTCAFKGAALSDLCEQLHGDTGVRLAAGPSVADEKVTLFCEKLPLREVMRQLSRPFGYTWLRSGTPEKYRYELVQDLRSQLLEEELRNRDRNAALLALDREIERYRPYLDLSPDEVLARVKSGTPDDKTLLGRISHYGWGAIQMYFRLSPSDLAALRSGQRLLFAQEPTPGMPPLPSDVARGVFQALREVRLIKGEKGYAPATDATHSSALPLTAIPEARAFVMLELTQSELGQFTLIGGSGFSTPGYGVLDTDGPVASGTNPSLLHSSNAVNIKLTREPALRLHVTVQPESSCCPSPDPGATAGLARQRGLFELPGSEPKATTADVLEALHQAAGVPIIADFYTRLYRPEMVSVKDQPLVEALGHLSDAMRLRWNQEEPWLQFRSVGFYNDRLKEVPNRLLVRWAAGRRQHGMLLLDTLMEIAQLPDEQLSGPDMAEGARNCFGLAEWVFFANPYRRPHWRFLAELSPGQRQEAMSASGLPFNRLSLAQQQRFIALAFEHEDHPLQSLAELDGAALCLRYTHPGWFQWGDPGAVDVHQYVIVQEPGLPGRRVPRPPVQERTREAAWQAARRIDPQADLSQIHPTQLQLAAIYIPGASNKRSVWVVRSDVAFGGSTQ